MNCYSPIASQGHLAAIPNPSHVSAFRLNHSILDAGIIIGFKFLSDLKHNIIYRFWVTSRPWLCWAGGANFPPVLLGKPVKVCVTHWQLLLHPVSLVAQSLEMQRWVGQARWVGPKLFFSALMAPTNLCSLKCGRIDDFACVCIKQLMVKDERVQ